VAVDFSGLRRRRRERLDGRLTSDREPADVYGRQVDRPSRVYDSYCLNTLVNNDIEAPYSRSRMPRRRDSNAASLPLILLKAIVQQ
jgi:hypothetical protein